MRVVPKVSLRAASMVDWKVDLRVALKVATKVVSLVGWTAELDSRRVAQMVVMTVVVSAEKKGIV